MEFVFFVWITEQTANANNIKIDFLNEVESVYWSVHTESLFNTDTFRL
jgi:hypothetical protein